MEIEKEIKQKSFKDEYEKVEVNLLFTASWVSSNATSLIKPHGISLQQFNILRILRGQKGVPAPLKLLTERMLDKMSNTSRLVEKLFQKGWVIRENCKENRRRVDISITEEGLRVCREVTDVIEYHREKNRVLSLEEAQQLNYLLDKMRG